jgi:hypothetical protein
MASRAPATDAWFDSVESFEPPSPIEPALRVRDGIKLYKISRFAFRFPVFPLRIYTQ